MLVLDLLLGLSSDDMRVLVNVELVLVEWESWGQIVAVVWVLVGQEVSVNLTGRQVRQGVHCLVVSVALGRSETAWQDTADFVALVRHLFSKCFFHVCLYIYLYIFISD